MSDNELDLHFNPAAGGEVLPAAERTKMDTERFNELLNGPLNHPMVMFRISRLAIALQAVLDACGEQADKALEAHCAARQRHDDMEDIATHGDDQQL